MSKGVKIAYVGQVAPYEPEFYNQPGYGRQGVLAQLGWIEALHNTRYGLDRAWGFRPISHWPKAKIQFEKTRRIRMSCGAELTLLPLVNYFLIKEVLIYLQLAFVLLTWSLYRARYKRVLVMYNMTNPNGIVWMRLVTWITRVKLVPIIYDMSRITTFKKSWLLRIKEPPWLDRIHEKLLPYCDGLFPITDAIPRDFAPRLRYFRVDGGVGDSVISKLPDIKLKSKDDNFVLMFAGGLIDWNCISLLFDYMEQNKDPRIRVWIAGGGQEERIVRDRVAKDSRIVYYGVVDLPRLCELYQNADILVSLRSLEDPGLQYHYPSKNFEMMAMGKPCILSNTAHTKEMYGKYCKVIDACDLASYSQAIDFFMKMTPLERYEYGAEARRYILENRAWKKWGGPIEEYLSCFA